ncbi:MAG: hypothetical protein QOI73_726 [Solirubrobacteraceae bacterium]|jgi:hypothetical protein|nr:hypothetical protein [Solirubrobacteraceae bacterium]
MAEVAAWEEQFAQEAAKDGIVLVPETFSWASEPGHLAIGALADTTGDMEVMQRAEVGVPALEEMFRGMGGLAPVLYSCRVNLPYPAVLLHEPTATLLCVDDVLHFTTSRLKTLALYPGEMPVGFDVKAYQELCSEHGPKTDKWRYGLASKMFGWHGLQKERAYQDAVRDIGSWVMGLAPLIRVPAIDEDGEAAYARVKDELHGKLKVKA